MILVIVMGLVMMIIIVVSRRLKRFPAFYILEKTLMAIRPHGSRKKPGSRFMEDTRLDHIWKSLSDGELWAEEEEDDEVSISSLPLHRWEREEEDVRRRVSNHLRPQPVASGRRSVNVFLVSRETASMTPVFRDDRRRRGLGGSLLEDPDFDGAPFREEKHSSKLTGSVSIKGKGFCIRGLSVPVLIWN